MICIFVAKEWQPGRHTHRHTRAQAHTQLPLYIIEGQKLLLYQLFKSHLGTESYKMCSFEGEYENIAICTYI